MAEKLPVILVTTLQYPEAQYIGSNQQTLHVPVSRKRIRSEIPTTYDELVAWYYEPIRKQVIGFSGISAEDVEDVVQTIFLQFIEGDYLQIYSKDKQSQYAQARYDRAMEDWRKGKLDYEPVRPEGKFSSFLFEFVKLRLLGIRDKLNRRAMTMRSLDSFVTSSDPNIEPKDTAELNFLGMFDEGPYNYVLRDLLKRIFVYLNEVMKPTPTKNYIDLFVTLVTDVFDRMDSAFDKRTYADRKNITVSAVNMQHRDLCRYLEQAGFYKEFKDLLASRRRYKKCRSM